MSEIRGNTQKIRQFVVRNVEQHSSDIATEVARKFGISRQATNRHLNNLVTEGVLRKSGKTRNLRYTLVPEHEWSRTYELNGLEEDQVWVELANEVGKIPDNARSILLYGVTEMVNNAIDHSEGSAVVVGVVRTPASISISIYDDGVGIFRKITQAMGLEDERHAVLELAKGKFTTDPSRHS